MTSLDERAVFAKLEALKEIRYDAVELIYYYIRK